MKLTTSDHMVKIKVDRRRYVIYHSLFGRPLTVSSALLGRLERLKEGAAISSVFTKDELRRFRAPLRELREAGFLIRKGFDEYALLNGTFYSSRRKEREEALARETGELFTSMRMEISGGCNFRCSYCFAEKIYEWKNSMMGLETAKSAVDGFLKILKRNGKTRGYILFWGGEPLLNWRVMRETIEYVRSVTQNTTVSIRMGICTNGSLISDEVARFMKEHALGCSVSLDGLGKENDSFRKFSNGRGTFRHILKGMEALSRHGVRFSVQAVLHKYNFRTLEKMFDFLSEKYGVRTFNVGPVAFQGEGVQCDDHSALAKARRIVEIFAHGENRRYRVCVGDMAQVNFAMDSSPRLFVCGGKSETLYVKPDGSVYPCQKICTPIGDIRQIDKVAKNESYKRVAGRGVDLIPSCRGCDIEGLCGGGCAGLAQFYSGNTHDTSNPLFRKTYCDYLRHLVKETFKHLALSQ